MSRIFVADPTKVCMLYATFTDDIVDSGYVSNGLDM